MFGMSRLQLSATLAAVVAGWPPFSLLAAAAPAPGAIGPNQALGESTPFLPESSIGGSRRLSTPSFLSDDSGTMMSTNGHGVAYLRYGKIFQWGKWAQSPTEIDLSSITTATPVRVAAGWYHTCAVLDDGKVACWGAMAQYGSMGDEAAVTRSAGPLIVRMDDGIGGYEDLDDVVEFVSGTHESCAVKSDRALVCFGDGGVANKINPQYDGSTDATKVRFVAAKGGSVSVVSETNEVRMFFYGNTEVRLVAPHPITQLDAGRNQACYLMDMPDQSAMNMRCVGKNNKGEFGNGATSTSPSATAVTPSGLDSKISFIAAEYYATCAIKASDQSQWCWGENGNNEGTMKLGVESSDEAVLLPSRVITTGHLEQSLINSIHVPRYAGFVLLTDGTVHAWGTNRELMLGIGDTDSTRVVSGTNSALPVFGVGGQAVITEPANWQPPDAWPGGGPPPTSTTPAVKDMTCPNGVGHVDCVDGLVANGDTCYKACGDGALCCSGTDQSNRVEHIDACVGFTGRVCMDGSCSGGLYACTDAKIGLVSNSCNGEGQGNGNGNSNTGLGARFACYEFGKLATTTSTLRLFNSCHGENACWRAVQTTGTLTGDIIDSCVGKDVCYGIAMQGTVEGDVRNSCRHNDVLPMQSGCASLAAGANGHVGSIIDSCNAGRACTNLGEHGTVQGLFNSCNGEWACNNMAKTEGSDIRQVVDCCNVTTVAATSLGCYYATADRPAVWDDTHIPSTCPTTVPATVTSTPAPTQAPTSSPTTISPTVSPTTRPTESPTTSPTSSPTTISPTTTPTTAPTEAPTSTPTQAPTVPGPWSLTFDNSTTSFSSGASNEIELDFLVGAGRQVRVSVYETCDAEANEIEPGAIFSRTVTPVPEESNSTHSMKKIGYNFNKTALIGSSLWNSTTDTLSFCQVTSLVTTGTSGAEWVIMEDRREIEIRFDLTANFIVNVTLEDETIESANETVSFDDQVKAYKCLGENTNTFVEDDTPLPPNTELAVCIESENDSVNLAELTDMVIEQDTERVFVVDSDGGIVIPAITSVDDYPDGIMVITRVPLDKFNFETGENITISGKVELELTSSRRLRALNEDNAAAAELEEVGYTVTVNLLSEGDSMGEVQAPIGSSDGYTMSGNSLGALGLMILAVIGLVM